MQPPVQTVGVSPKVPVQAIITVLAFILAYFGIDLDAILALALSVLTGAAGGFRAGPGEVQLDPATSLVDPDELDAIPRNA